MVLIVPKVLHLIDSADRGFLVYKGPPSLKCIHERALPTSQSLEHFFDSIKVLVRATVTGFFGIPIAH
jgi:hypothetical protein